MMQRSLLFQAAKAGNFSKIAKLLNEINDSALDDVEACIFRYLLKIFNQDLNHIVFAGNWVQCAAYFCQNGPRSDSKKIVETQGKPKCTSPWQ